MESIPEELKESLKGYEGQIRSLFIYNHLTCRVNTEGMDHFETVVGPDASKTLMVTEPAIKSWYDACEMLRKYEIVSRSDELAVSRNGRNKNLTYSLTDIGSQNKDRILGIS
jgi:hypothetical protein